MARTVHCDYPTCDRETVSDAPAEAVGWLIVSRMDGAPGRHDYDPGPWHFCGGAHLEMYVEKFGKP